MSAAEEIRGLKAVGVSIADMRGTWPYIEKYFRSFEERSRKEISAAELLHQVMQGIRQCWIVTDGQEVRACALTEILDVPTQTILLNFCAGEGSEDWWQELVDTIERWGRSRGSKRLRTVNRPGWTKRLKQAGYRETHRVLEKDL